MNQLSIIKIGGNIIDSEPQLKKFLSDFSSIKKPKLLIHGGGKTATEMAEKLGVSQVMIDGRRITDAETLKITTMVYAGLVNKQIVALLQAKGVNAIGLSGADMNCILASKRQHPEIDFGFVGDICMDGINVSFLSSLIESNAVPVFCPITHDGKGQLLNTNADTIASTLAVALSKKYEVQLCYCFEKKGVLENIEDEDSVMESISKTKYKDLVEKGMISKGMIAKLDNAFEATAKGVQSVIIGHADNLLQMINKEEHAGTRLFS